MSGRLLLDTNAVLAFLKGQPSMVALLEATGADSLFASVITRMELLSFHGITPDEEKHIREFLNAVSIIPLNTEVEDTAIQLRRVTRRKMPDAVVAASAIVSKAVLVTYDLELAGMVFPGLMTRHPENPA